MAVHVLLAFEDEEEAKTFVEHVVGGGHVASLHRDSTADDTNVYGSGAVCGVWKAPSLFCECTTNKSNRVRGYKRGKKYGWWVHDLCGKPAAPTKIAATEWESALGTNLLPAELAPEAFKYRYKNWRSPLEWTWLLEKLSVKPRARGAKPPVYDVMFDYPTHELEELSEENKPLPPQ